jgi:hypothetical protein
MALHQNPLYPFLVSVLGHVVFDGEPAQAFRTDKEAEFVSAPRQWFYYPFIENFRWSQSWGATFAALMYMLPIVPLAMAFGNRRRNPRLAAAHGFCFAIVLFGWVTWAALTAREPRYNLFVFGVMLASGAALMSVGPDRYRRAMGTLFLATMIVNFYFTAQLISERYWIKAEQALPERTIPGFQEVIDAAPTGILLAKPYGRFSLMLYGDQMRRRVQHTLHITSEQLTTLRPVLVAESTKTGLPYTSLLAGNPDYKLAIATQFEGRDYSLYQRVAASAEPERRYFELNRPAAIQTSACAPTSNPWTMLDGKLGTGWSAGGKEASEWVELNWAAPINTGWVEVSFFKLDYDGYRIRTRHDGKWKTVARVKHAPAPGGKPHNSIDKIQLNGHPIDGLRVQADRPKQAAKKAAGKPEKKIFNLVEVAGYPPLTRADIALALAMVIGVALSPFEFRSTRQD